MKRRRNPGARQEWLHLVLPPSSHRCSDHRTNSRSAHAVANCSKHALTSAPLFATAREETMSDRALLVSWYDLAENGQERYLAWLHNKYMPKLLATPGVLGAAHYEVDQTEKPLPHLRHTDDTTLPTGNRYILILTGGDAHVFSRLSSFRL